MKKGVRPEGTQDAEAEAEVGTHHVFVVSRVPPGPQGLMCIVVFFSVSKWGKLPSKIVWVRDGRPRMFSCNPSCADFRTVGSIGTGRTRMRGASESGLDQARAPEKALSRSNSSSTIVDRNLADFGCSVGSVNSFEGILQADDKAAHFAKKVVKFKANNKPDGQMSDDLHSLQVSLSHDNSKTGSTCSTCSTGSVRVAPVANDKRSGRRYSVDDCGIAIAHRTELNVVQVKSARRHAFFQHRMWCLDALFVKSNCSTSYSFAPRRYHVGCCHDYDDNYNYIYDLWPFAVRLQQPVDTVLASEESKMADALWNLLHEQVGAQMCFVVI